MWIALFLLALSSFREELSVADSNPCLYSNSSSCFTSARQCLSFQHNILHLGLRFNITFDLAVYCFPSAPSWQHTPWFFKHSLSFLSIGLFITAAPPPLFGSLGWLKDLSASFIFWVLWLGTWIKQDTSGLHSAPCHVKNSYLLILKMWEHSLFVP